MARTYLGHWTMLFSESVAFFGWSNLVQTHLETEFGAGIATGEQVELDDLGRNNKPVNR